MRDILDTIEASISAEVADASSWTFAKQRPLWRNPGDGKTLYIYPDEDGPSGGFDTTDAREEELTIFIEYVEPATSQAKERKRDPEAELDVTDVAKALKTWARNHKLFGTSEWDSLETNVHRFVHMRTYYNPPRELLVRYCRLLCVAYTRGSYGSDD